MSHDPRGKSDSRLTGWLLAFAAVGIFLRLLRYAMNMPVWGDEAMLSLNLLNRGYAGLRQPLDYGQVAPIGFLWAERWMYLHWGMSEYSMRFLPMLAGISGIVLFAGWSRLLASDLAAAIAVGILAVGNYCVRYAVELKPYGFDFFAAMLLLFPATMFLLRRQTRWLLCLIALTPLSLALSYPAIFVAGGIGLALALEVRRMSRPQIALGAALGLVMIAGFWFLVWRVAAGQYQVTQSGMTTYWKDAFPPANPLRLIWWLVLIHTGNMFEYPFGGANGASTGSFLVFVVGLLAWWRPRRWAQRCLILAPFALNFAAAAIRRYPYGQSARVAQALAPAIILLIGVGAATLIERLTSNPVKRLRSRQAIFAGLLIFGALVAADTVLHPYKSRDDAEARQVIHDMFQRAAATDTIAVLMPRDKVHVTLQWYLRQQDRRITWNAMADRSWVAATGPVWVLNLTPTAGIRQRLQADLRRPLIFYELKAANHDLDTVPLRYWELFGFGKKNGMALN
jgi:4-amino-4-deoxy-L-arabinose transferase-like glycosyltransferase